MYDTELNNVVDVLLPKRQFVHRPRPTDPWFDKECRDAKRATRRLERKFAACTRRAAVVTASVVGTSQFAVVSAATSETTAAKAAWYNQRRLYRQLRLKKCSEYWSGRIEADQYDPRKLWKSVDTLLGRGRLPASSAIDVVSFTRFFADKVSKVRSSTSSAPSPTFSRLQSGASFCNFRPTSTVDVINAIRKLPGKSSAADPLPTPVLKEVADVVAPFVSELFNSILKWKRVATLID